MIVKPKGVLLVWSARLQATVRAHRKLFVTTVLVAGCASDAAVCIYYPCPLPNVGTITVTGTNAPIRVADLAVTVSGATSGSAPCSQGFDGTIACNIYGPLGTYHVQLSAPGYQSAAVDFTATGTEAGCNTCGHVDVQQRAVVLQLTP